MQVHGVEAFDDNYIWVIDEGTEQTAVVDPGDADPVLEFMQQHDKQVAAILITHKHYDHVGGIAQIKQAWPDCTVFGPANEPINGLDVRLSEGEVVELPGMGFKPRVMEVPGHTEGHIAYYGNGSLFCGDTMFACGCGRVFSGTMGQLHHSLSKIAALPDDTLAYCAHEYTLENIGFAKWVEPDNPDLIQRETEVRDARSRGIPTVPSRLVTEKTTNPFLRSDVESVIMAAERHAGHKLGSAEQVFTELRQWKDREYD
jgi:hydroxyacylglutathione hydrolase